MKTLDVAKIAAVVLGAFAAYKFVQKVKAVGGDVATAGKKFIAEDLNPASDKNLVYSGVNSVGANVTGDKDFNIGVKVWEFLNPEKVAQETALSEASNVKKQGPAIAATWEMDDPSVKTPSFNNPFADVEATNSNSIGVVNGHNFNF